MWCGNTTFNVSFKVFFIQCKRWQKSWRKVRFELIIAVIVFRVRVPLNNNWFLNLTSFSKPSSNYFGQFHKHFTRTFYVRKSFEQLLSALALNELSYEKCACKMLMKLTPFHFTNEGSFKNVSKKGSETKALR